jgi:hypothetical protein
MNTRREQTRDQALGPDRGLPPRQFRLSRRNLHADVVIAANAEEFMAGMPKD